jgi:hypothetical protein
MKWPVLYCGTALLVLTSLPASAQGIRQLTIDDVIRLPGRHQQPGLAVKVPVKCSQYGDLYVEFMGGGAESGVSLFSADHGRVGHFAITHIPQLQDALVYDFAPGRSRDVFLLVAKKVGRYGLVEHYVAHLMENGSSSVTKLQFKADAQPRQMAVLGSENFVVSGFFGSGHTDPGPFVAIFNAQGELMRPLALTGDVSSVNKSPNIIGDQPSSSDSLDAVASEVTAKEWSELSSLQTADDGSVYLLRPSPQGPAFIISPGGAVGRVALKPPEKDAVLSSAKMAGGRIAAEYYIPRASDGVREHFITVTDASTGQQLDTVRYQVRPINRVGNGLLCARDF